MNYQMKRLKVRIDGKDYVEKMIKLDMIDYREGLVRFLLHKKRRH